MPHILDGLEPIRMIPKEIDAACYNRVRVALLRQRRPLRIRLPSHRCLDVILTDSAWLCVDATGQDLPVLAWTDFNTARRDALHLPVHCNLHLYHMHAGLVMGSAAEALAQGEWLDSEGMPVML